MTNCFYCIIICITSSSHAVHDGYFGVQEKKKAAAIPVLAMQRSSSVNRRQNSARLVLAVVPALFALNIFKKLFSGYNNNKKSSP